VGQPMSQRESWSQLWARERVGGPGRECREVACREQAGVKIGKSAKSNIHVTCDTRCSEFASSKRCSRPLTHDTTSHHTSKAPNLVLAYRPASSLAPGSLVISHFRPRSLATSHLLPALLTHFLAHSLPPTWSLDPHLVQLTP